MYDTVLWAFRYGPDLIEAAIGLLLVVIVALLLIICWVEGDCGVLKVIKQMLFGRGVDAYQRSRRKRHRSDSPDDIELGLINKH